jgi:uncharacterized protein (DUF2141 family)
MGSGLRVGVFVLLLSGLLYPGRLMGKQASGRIVVEAENFRDDRGEALYALFRTEDGFPKQPLKAAQRIAGAISEAHSRVVFEDVEPGEFAISVLHDEDRNHLLKTGVFGIPREGIGFSRDARGRMGPPKFRDAKLSLSEGDSVTVRIRLVYY